jgi:hypothetical protein
MDHPEIDNAYLKSTLNPQSVDHIVPEDSDIAGAGRAAQASRINSQLTVVLMHGGRSSAKERQKGEEASHLTRTRHY